MRRVETIMSLFLTMGLLGCVEKEEEANVITVDVTTTYPKKELVLQNLVDVEYIPLETNDEFITQGNVMAIGEKYILVKNWNYDGNIFVFDRKIGKGIRKINRKGRGDGEYSFINGIILDEDNNETFINCASTKRIYVYDLSGNFRRDFRHVEGGEYLEVFNYDKNNLIYYDMSLYYKEGQPRGENRSYRLIISKQDGSVTQRIYIPFDVIKAPAVQKGGVVAMTSTHSIISYRKEWLLVEASSDTVYNYVSEKNQLNPFLIKSPTRDLEILLTVGVVTDRCCLMHTVKEDFDFTTGRGFLITDLMYDKQENAVFETSVPNGDFVEKQNLDMLSDPMNDDGIVATQPLAANKIVDAYKNDGLKGKLKEIATGLDKESNPVTMLVKNREQYLRFPVRISQGDF